MLQRKKYNQKSFRCFVLKNRSFIEYDFGEITIENIMYRLKFRPSVRYGKFWRLERPSNGRLSRCLGTWWLTGTKYMTIIKIFAKLETKLVIRQAKLFNFWEVHTKPSFYGALPLTITRARPPIIRPVRNPWSGSDKWHIRVCGRSFTQPVNQRTQPSITTNARRTLTVSPSQWLTSVHLYSRQRSTSGLLGGFRSEFRLHMYFVRTLRNTYLKYT